MVDKRNKNRSLVASSLVTLSVIAMLIASVPASAVTVSISGLSGSITQGTSKMFMVTVTMENPDKFVPVSNITLSIKGPTTKQWTFNPVCGILTSTDKNITVKVISPPNTGNLGHGYGYGVDTVGYGYGYNFGYGYGYGYNNGQGGGRISFTYQVTLLTTDLAAGSYTATAYLNTGNPAKANFASSDTSFTIVPRNTQDKGNISGMKFNDSNADSIKNPWEPGLENWTIKLIDSGGNVETATTDANGNYNFSGLLEDNYTVAEVPMPGWTQTFPIGGVYTVNLKPGENMMNADFGNFNGSLGIPEISGMKFNDSNGNGKKDPGEAGLADWLIKLNDSFGNTLTTITDSNGNYTFHLSDTDGGIGAGSNLRGLNYTVAEVLKPGWTQTFPVNGTYNVQYMGEQNLQPLDFKDLDFGNTAGMLSSQTVCNLQVAGKK
ncbi:SdrD B-like domain protein [uncultured archaeon]|nr:SdrD B-like domain protein [uncultured archaeon]